LLQFGKRDCRVAFDNCYTGVVPRAGRV
jgi:hypothetical protein